MIIVADTSALYAAFDAAQPEHGAARAIMEREILAISPLVITELDRLVHRDLGFPATMAVQESLNARIASCTDHDQLTEWLSRAVHVEVWLTTCSTRTATRNSLCVHDGGVQAARTSSRLAV